MRSGLYYAAAAAADQLLFQQSQRHIEAAGCYSTGGCARAGLEIKQCLLNKITASFLLAHFNMLSYCSYMRLHNLPAHRAMSNRACFVFSNARLYISTPRRLLLTAAAAIVWCQSPKSNCLFFCKLSFHRVHCT